MMYKEILEKHKDNLEKNLDFLKSELTKIRTGKASPSLVEDIMVDYLGTNLPLKQLSSISCPEARQILITPWDKGCIEAIVGAISKSSLGISPIVDKDAIRISMPMLTEEYRNTLKKLIAEKKEAARQGLRRIRQDISKEIDANFSKKELTEDDKFKARDELQKITDEQNKKMDELVSKKEQEITL